METSIMNFKGPNTEYEKTIVMASPYPLIFILILYLWFVLKSGPEFMKNRRPFQLDTIVGIYNAMQVALSFYISQAATRLLFQVGLYSATCYSEHGDETVKDLLNHCNDCYILAKVSELLDTVFFVLRKKQNQVSFLHVYHHTAMIICTWIVVKEYKSDSIVFIGTVNSLVHVVMYSYYGLSMFPRLRKYLWWKKYITVLQMVQLTLVIVHLLISHVTSGCKPVYAMFLIIFANTVALFCLFLNFYMQSYKPTNIDERQ